MNLNIGHFYILTFQHEIIDPSKMIIQNSIMLGLTLENQIYISSENL